MARKNRRNAHRYEPDGTRCRLGWSASGGFRTVSARLANLSVSGALLTIEDAAMPPSPGRVMLALGESGLEQWTSAELIEVSTPPDGPRQLRIRLLEPVSYEVFKATVWGQKPTFAQAPAAAEDPPGRVVWESEEAPLPDRAAIRRESPRPRQAPEPPQRPSQLDSDSSPSHSLREARPGLVETHRHIRSSLDRVEPIPWLTIALFSALAILLIVIAVSRHCGTSLWLCDMLSALR